MDAMPRDLQNVIDEIRRQVGIVFDDERPAT